MRYKIKIKINDDERQLIVKALYDWRNELPTDSLLRPDLEQLILKIIDPPDAQKKRQELKDRIDTLLSELDTRIKVSNATTMIEF